MSKSFAESLREVIDLGLSQSDVSSVLGAAVREQFSADDWAQLLAVYGDQKRGSIVYFHDSKHWKASYTLKDAKAKIDFVGASEVVPRVVYDEPGQQARESQDTETILVGDVVDLREGAVGQDGTVSLKLIAPGWGSSGYYPASVLERDGPQIFRAGTQNFWDHMTDSEEAARPEGSLRNLASVLTEDARYLADAPDGPGLYARAKVFSEFRQPVDDLAKHIGMSIRAAGIARDGEAEGRRGKVIERLTRADSVDYVTRPGAGGKVLQLFEAVRNRAAIQTQNEGDDMDLAKLQETVEAQSKLIESQARQMKQLLREAALRNAATAIDTHLAGVRIGDAVKARVKAAALESVVIADDNSFDAAKLKEAVERALADEVAYLEAVNPTGRVTNLGLSQPTREETEASEARAKESFDAAMDDLASVFVGAGDGAKTKREIFKAGRAN